jgi:hypothetical protein
MAFLKGIRNSATARSPAVSSCYGRAKWQHVHSDSDAKKTRKRRHYLRGLAEKVPWFEFPARGSTHSIFQNFPDQASFSQIVIVFNAKSFAIRFHQVSFSQSGSAKRLNHKMKGDQPWKGLQFLPPPATHHSSLSH